MAKIIMPTVSVMVVVYNAKEFIAECIDSILSQNYQNIEIIVSDDCSTDGTQEILKQYSADKRVKLLFNQKNIGITPNCNQALLQCTGEYICLFAGDDVMLPNKISAQLDLFAKNSEASLCYHKVDIFDSDTNETMYETEAKGQTIYSFFDIIDNAGLPGVTSVMVRRKHLPASLYNSQFPIVSDWLLMIEVALRGQVIFVDGVYTRYRKHISGVSMKADELLDETLSTLDYIEQRFAANPKISSSCKKSRKRHLLGAVYRALQTSNINLLDDLAQRFFKNGNSLIAIMLILYMNTGLHFTSFNEMICRTIRLVAKR